MRTINLIFLLLYGFTAHCQSTIKFGGENSFFGKNFLRSFNQGGIGLTCNYNIQLTKKSELHINTAWQRFYDYSIDPYSQAVDILPLRAGYTRTFFNTNFGSFAEAGTATTFFLDRTLTDLSLSAGLFYRFRLMNTHYIQSSLLYTYCRYSEIRKNDYYAWCSLRFEYGFVLPKRQNNKK